MLGYQNIFPLKKSHKYFHVYYATNARINTNLEVKFF
jgi:hypothetical protein